MVSGKLLPNYFTCIKNREDYQSALFKDQLSLNNALKIKRTKNVKII